MVSVANKFFSHTCFFLTYRSLDWRRRDTWEVMSPWDTVVLESTESRQVVEVLLVVCITRESWWTNSKCLSVLNLHFLLFDNSHPGYFGKVGMRVFHMQRNWKYCPTINTDKLWSLVSDATRQSCLKNKDKAPVIDVTKSVSSRALYIRNKTFTLSLFLLFNTS